jgi:hypothetical protein
LKLRSYFRACPSLLVLVGTIFIGGCAASFGPGYIIDKQDIDVHFDAGPRPHISIKSNYELTNTGTRPLSVLELRLPGTRRFKSANVMIDWDGQALDREQSRENPRNTLLTLPHPWAVSDRHSIHIALDLETASEGDAYLGFAPDAFFLPAQGWAPELLPARGIFATGGIPPRKWNLTVHVPKGFVIHTSGDKIKTSKHGEELTVRATQRVADIYPYVIAGRYVSKQIGSEREKIYLWTRKAQEAGDLRAVSDSLLKTLESYDSAFGMRSVAEAPKGFLGRHHGNYGKNQPPLWLVECPVIPGCFGDRIARNARMFGDNDQAVPGEMVSLDSAMIDPSPGAKKMVSAAAPALAASWLGYGQSPGFYEQVPPLSAFPAFAAAVGDEASNGPTARTDTIRRALAAVPKENASLKKDDENALRAKSFLFFYGLQDRYGNGVFRKAVRHMLDARRSGGFDLDDLIAAFDEQSHGNTAEFVRLWMKHPGVPSDFRARYENTSADKNVAPKEITP